MIGPTMSAVIDADSGFAADIYIVRLALYLKIGLYPYDVYRQNTPRWCLNED